MEKHKQNKKGFTIIEVVLVLAIASLIFLTVFLALPALQRSQRDTQRKNDMARMKAAYQQFKSVNKGRNIGGEYNGEYKPELENWRSFFDTHLRANGETFQDPSGENYFAQVGLWGFVRTQTAGTGVLTINYGHICSTTPENNRAITPTGATQGDITVQIPLESGGIYCVDLNQ